MAGLWQFSLGVILEPGPDFLFSFIKALLNPFNPISANQELPVPLPCNLHTRGPRQVTVMFGHYWETDGDLILVATAIEDRD